MVANHRGILAVMPPVVIIEESRCALRFDHNVCHDAEKRQERKIMWHNNFVKTIVVEALRWTRILRD